MSKRKKTTGRRKTAGAGDYKRGYANGVAAAVDAMLDDLDEHGKLDWLEYEEDGRAKTCKGCVLTAQHFPRVADRFYFVMGIKHSDAIGRD
jgi:hypothetical protein